MSRRSNELAGREFKIGSPKQLSVVLFDELELPVIKKTKTGISTDIEVLEELALVHPLPAQIISYRQFAKLKNTYVDALPGLVNPADRSNSHVIQSDRSGHGAAQFERSQPAEYPGPYQRRAGNSFRLRAG